LSINFYLLPYLIGVYALYLSFIYIIKKLFISFMPIGVPKVAYRLPGEAVPQWVDLYNRLYRERVLFLGSALDDELANQLNGIMLYLSAEDSNRRLFLYINSPGGSVTAGLSVFDIMNYVDAAVTTIGIGFAASMASFILAGGERGSRIALPHCRIMIHQPQGGMEGQASEIVLEKDEIIRLRKLIGRLYVDLTGQSASTVARDLDRDKYLSAREAREYGLVDLVASNDNNNV
jgi:ATP-dependent Clp protease protease subunit